MSTELDETQCMSCGGADPRCSAFHPEYGFTCIMPDPHSGPHYDTGGGHWTERGQLWFSEFRQDTPSRDRRAPSIRVFAEGLRTMEKTIVARVAGHVSSLDVQKDLAKGSLLLIAYVDDMIDEPGELGRAWLRLSPELVDKLRTRLDEIYPR